MRTLRLWVVCLAYMVVVGQQQQQQQQQQGEDVQLRLSGVEYPQDTQIENPVQQPKSRY